MANPPIQTVSSLVEAMRRAGRSEEYISEEFQKRFGAPHTNLPGETSLQTAQRWSPKVIKTRGPEAAQGYEKMFFAPSETLSDKMDTAVPVQEPVAPSTISPEDSGQGSEAQDEIAKLEILAAMSPPYEESEVRGGVTDPAESMKRIGGWVGGVGRSLKEASPWAPGEVWGPPTGSEPGPHETEKTFIARQKKEHPSIEKRPGETDASFADRQNVFAQNEAQRQKIEVNDREAFQKVLLDPKHSLSDIINATPIGRELKKGNDAALQRYEDNPIHGLLYALANGSFNLLSFLPKVVIEPLSSFEVPVDQSSYEHGAMEGKKVIPTMVTSTALKLPGIGLIDSAAEDPLGTLFMYMPFLQGVGAGAKLLPGSAPIAAKLQKFSQFASEGARAQIAKVLDTVATNTGLTSQTLMDRFYNKDPAITALMENAFADGGTKSDAIKKLTDMFAVASQRVHELSNKDRPIPPVTGGGLASHARDIAQVLFDAGIKDPKTGQLKYPTLESAWQFVHDGLLPPEGAPIPLGMLTTDEWVGMLKKNLKIGGRTLDSVKRIIADTIQKDGQTVTIDDVLKKATDAVVPEETFDALGRLKEVLHPENFKPTLEQTGRQTNLRLEAVGDAIRKGRIETVLSDEAKNWPTTATEILDQYTSTGTLPNVLRIAKDEFDKLVMRAAGDKSLYQQLQKMTPSKDAEGLYISKPLQFMQDLEASKQAFRNSVGGLSSALNSFVKGSAVGMNPASIVSNMFGNAVTVAMKLGTLPHTEMFELANAARRFVKYTRGTGAPEDARVMGAAARSGIFGTDRMTADVNLYAIAAGEEPGAIMPWVAKVTGYNKLKELGGKGMTWGDEGAKVRLFEKTFNKLDDFVQNLQEGESVSFRTGPNTKGTITLVDGKTVFRNEVPAPRGTTKLVEKVVSGKELDDALAKGAVMPANDVLFNYQRVPGYIETGRQTPLVGSGSPFFTYSHKALSIPFLKRGMAGAILDTMDGITSTSQYANAKMAVDSIDMLARRAAISAMSNLDRQTDEERQLYTHDPQSPGTSIVRGRGNKGYNAETASVQNLSSANWMEGLQTTMNLFDGIADTVGSALGDNTHKYIKIANNPPKNATPEQLAKFNKQEELAYFAALREMKRKVLTPELIPSVFAITGQKGSMLFDLYAKSIEATNEGKVAPSVSDYMMTIVPPVYRKAWESGTALAGVGAGKEKMARGIPEGEDANIVTLPERMKFALGNLTGLVSMPVDSEKQAKKIASSFTKELTGRLATWELKRKAELQEKFGKMDVADELESERDDIEMLIKDTADNWIDSLGLKGVTGFRETTLPQPKDAK